MTCALLTTAATGGTAGGGFNVADARTITAAITAGTTTVVTTSGSGYALTVVGAVTGGASTNARGIENATAVNLIITGACTGGSGTGAHAVNNASTGTVNVTGACTGGTANNGPSGVYNVAGATITVSGTVTGGSGTSYTACGVKCQAACTVDITGSVVGGGGNGANYGVGGFPTTLIVTSGNLIAGTAAVPTNVPPTTYSPLATNYLTPKAAGTKFVAELPAGDIRSGVVSGTVTGTYAGAGGVGPGILRPQSTPVVIY